MEPTREALSKNSPAEAKSTAYRAVVWLDHREARITYVRTNKSDGHAVPHADPPRQLHIRSADASGMNLTDEPQFYHEVATACDQAMAVLLVGTPAAKQDFVRYLHRRAPRTFELIAQI